MATTSSIRSYKTSRGFHGYEAEKYQNERGEFIRLVQESSAIGDADDAFDKPGSSFLWVCEHLHLSREEVVSLIQHMQRWVDTGTLRESPHATP